MLLYLPIGVCQTSFPALSAITYTDIMYSEADKIQIRIEEYHNADHRLGAGWAL
ncbi:hypothetical protein KDAU_62660 [Dictyobacter aurantiacus]|uniref:Uncharacterized protein n=1 Tax=Dictyobacter aurantiacus TaxID=1936993 RepID=A0A401ZPZ3_9CHLR|nr:hypothetical protein KDAU_62660 [Dictyobacter aurantiacus]